MKDRDYSEATVVLLYMGNEFNNLLKPILEKQLKPGTRIVSHRFLLGDWAPDKTIKVTGKRRRRVHPPPVDGEGKGEEEVGALRKCGKPGAGRASATASQRRDSIGPANRSSRGSP